LAPPCGTAALSRCASTEPLRVSALPGDDQHGGTVLTQRAETGPGLPRPDRIVGRFTPAMGWATLPFRPAAPDRNARAALTSSSFRPCGCCPAPPAGLPVASSPPTPFRG